MVEPKSNRSKEAIALRDAAGQWAMTPSDLNDPEDKEGMRLNRALLKAAIAYAKVAENV